MDIVIGWILLLGCSASILLIAARSLWLVLHLPPEGGGKETLMWVRDERSRDTFDFVTALERIVLRHGKENKANGWIHYGHPRDGMVISRSMHIREMIVYLFPPYVRPTMGCISLVVSDTGKMTLFRNDMWKAKEHIRMLAEDLSCYLSRGPDGGS